MRYNLKAKTEVQTREGWTPQERRCLGTDRAIWENERENSGKGIWLARVCAGMIQERRARSKPYAHLSMNQNNKGSKVREKKMLQNKLKIWKEYERNIKRPRPLPFSPPHPLIKLRLNFFVYRELQAKTVQRSHTIYNHCNLEDAWETWPASQTMISVLRFSLLGETYVFLEHISLSPFSISLTFLQENFFK